MPFVGKHIILKQTVDLEYNGHTDGFELQREVSEWCYHELIPVLEEQLERLQTKGSIYRINRLDIAVEIDEGGNWKANATTQVAQQLQDKVGTILRKYHQDSALNPITYPQLFVETFIHFLQHGHLPWWSPVATHQLWLEELNNLMITGFGEAARARLLPLLKQQAVQQRVIYQLSDEIFIKLMVQVNAGIGKDITSLINDIKQLVKDGEERKTVLALFRQSVMQVVFDVGVTGFAEKVYAHFVQQLSAYSHLQHIQISESKLIGSMLKQLPTEERARLQQRKENAQPMNKDPQQQEQAANKQAITSQVQQEGLYIENAGLVIIAPFLPMLFKKLGLYNDETITDFNRAAGIVQYIASGRERVAEFELGLAKLLCGMETDTPVDTDITLSPEDKNEINDLLVSAIEYWSVLKDTSPEGLRHSFLQRPGKLQLVKNDWLLQVEQKPWDVLLQQLPWNISMLKLPWMPQLLRTEWVQ